MTYQMNNPQSRRLLSESNPLPAVTGARARALPTHQEAKFSQMTHNGRVDRIMHYSPINDPCLVYFSLIPDLTYVGSRRVGVMSSGAEVSDNDESSTSTPDGLNRDVAEGEDFVPPPAPNADFPRSPPPPPPRVPPADPLRGPGDVLVRYFHYYKYVPVTPYIMMQIVRHHLLPKRIVVSSPKAKVVFIMNIPQVAKEAMHIRACTWWFQSEGLVVVKEDRWETTDDSSTLEERVRSGKPHRLSLRDDFETLPRHPVTNLWMARHDPLWVASTVPELFLKAIVQVDSPVQAGVLMNRLLQTIVELRDFDYDYYYGRGSSTRLDAYQVGVVPEVGRGTEQEVRTRVVQRYKVLLRESVSRMPELAVPHNTPNSLNTLTRLPSIWLGVPDLHADAKPRLMEGKDVVRGPVIGLPIALGPIFTRVATPLYPSVGPVNPLQVYSARLDIGPPCNSSMTVKNRGPFLRKYKERGQDVVSKYIAPHPYVGANFLVGSEIAKFDHWVVKNICNSDRKGFLSGNKRVRSEKDRRVEESQLEEKLKVWPAALEDLDPLYEPSRRSWLHETLQDIHRRHHACVQLIGLAQDQIAAHEKRFKGYITFDANAFVRGRTLFPMGGANITNMHLLGGSRKESAQGKPEPPFNIDPNEVASVDAYWAQIASYHPQNRMVVDLSGFAVDVTGPECSSLRKKWLRLTHRFHEDLKTHLPIICVGGFPLPPLAVPDHIRDGSGSTLVSPNSMIPPAFVEDSGATQPQTFVAAQTITVSPTVPLAREAQPSMTATVAEKAVAPEPKQEKRSSGKEYRKKREHRRKRSSVSGSDSDGDVPPPPPPPNRPPPTKWRKYIDANTKEPYYVLMGYRDIPGPPKRHGESGQGAPSPNVQTERVVLDTVWERPAQYESD